MRTSKILNQIHCMILALTVAAGCARSSRTIQAPDHLQIRNYPETLKKLESLPFKEACDSKIFKVRHDLVEELSALKDKISSNPHPRAQTGNRVKNQPELIPFQGSYLVGDSEIIQNTPAEWDQLETSWIATREKLDKNQNLSDQDRFSLMNHTVQSLLMNDTFRSFHEINMGINHDTVGLLTDIQAAITSCVRDSSCSFPLFSEILQKAISKIPLYSKLLKEIDLATNEKDKREVILKFQDRLRQDIHRYLYRGNAPVIKLTEDQKTILKLALNPGSLKEGESKILEKSIEELWKNANTFLQVAWTTSDAGSNLFKVLFHLNEPGKRANTDPGDHSVNLYPGTRVRSVAHEVGHVLGFPDHYYTVWNEEKCSYTQYSITTDLMSDSQRGKVTDEEWVEMINALQSPQS